MCIKEALWLKKFAPIFDGALQDVDVRRMFDIVIGEDNMACIPDAHNRTTSEFSKHVDNKFQLLVDHVGKGDVAIQYVPMDEMIADVFTKNLKRNEFAKMMKLLNMS